MKKNVSPQLMKTAVMLSTAVVMFFSAAVFNSCKEDEEEPLEKPALTVSPATLDKAPAAGQTYTITVTANQAWTVKTSESFITVLPDKGNGNGSFVITVAENSATVTRSADVTVAGGGITHTIAVTQEAAGEDNPDAPTLTVSPGSLTGKPATADTYPITVTANVAWVVAITAGNEFITPSTHSGTNSGSFSVALSANTGTERAGTVTVTGGGITRTIAVTQADANAAPTLEISPSEVTAPAAGTTQPIAVTSNVAWTASVTEGNFITLLNESGSGNDSFDITVAENSTTATRTGTVTVTSGDLARTIAVTQAAAGEDNPDAPTLTVLPESLTGKPATAGTYPITVTANVAWAVSVAEGEGNNFITPSTYSGSGNGSFSVALAANTGTERAGTVTVTGGGITRTIAVTQADANAAPELEISPSEVDAPAAGTTQPIAVTSNQAWTVTKTDEFITLLNESGSGNGSFDITVAENSATATRTGTVTVTSGDITRTIAVTQAAASPFLTISPAERWVVAEGDAAEFNITSNVAWTVSSDAGWAVPSPTSGSDNSQLSVTIAENNGAERTATITVSDGNTLSKTITINQNGATQLELSTLEAHGLSGLGDAKEIAVTCNQQWTATVTDGTDFITLSFHSGSGLTITPTGDVSFTITVTENPSTTDVHSGTVTVTSGNKTRIVSVKQEPKPLAPPPPPEFVEIASIKWATRNVDTPTQFATDAWSYGKLYQFNRTVPYVAGPDDLAKPSDWNETNDNFTANWDETTNAICPTGWRLPTKDEITALFNSGESGLVEYNGIKGRFFGPDANAKANGDKAASYDAASAGLIFLPFYTMRDDNTGETKTDCGFYCSSTVSTSTDKAFMLQYTDGWSGMIGDFSQKTGGAIRCVQQ
jgi:uncharacterized protein (TIGR02145 family)